MDNPLAEIVRLREFILKACPDRDLAEEAIMMHAINPRYESGKYADRI